MARELLNLRRGLLVRTAFEVLRDKGDFVARREVFRLVAERIDLTDDELEVRGKYQSPRYEDILDFRSGNASRLGWIEKNGAGWRITPAGLATLERLHPDENLDAKLTSAYRQLRKTELPAAWLVRGSNIAGQDLVTRLWLSENLVSLQAARLRDSAGQCLDKETLRSFIDEDYESTTTYNQKQELVEDFHTFLSRMKPGDTIVTLSSGQLYLGEITGQAEQVKSEDSRSNLRRRVEWQETGFDYNDLPDELQQKLSVQHDVVDLTTVLDLLNSLGLSDEELAAEQDEDPTVEAAIFLRREVELPDPDQDLADELLVERDWLQEVRDLLSDDRQLVFYGPPGTGKTFLAQEIAEYLGGGPEQVKLIQFHPSYSYEDFFEGFRPREDPKTGEVAFRLTAGPLRELADRASREGNRLVPHFLIIDELNRANLAKVFGELYFLLEYRNKSVRLTYSAEDFPLPPNVFIIGTMNTADRSIALVDAAMRRRFAFVELSPKIEPTKGLLYRWLEREKKDLEPALLLDALNARIKDENFKIGPSYLMKPGVYREGGLDRTWRTKILPLLAEHHYGEEINIERTYGLATLRKAIAHDRQIIESIEPTDAPTDE
jgi:5-methylcytosine-specific restriction enzyme B